MVAVPYAPASGWIAQVMARAAIGLRLTMLQETRLHRISALLATLDRVTTGRISEALGISRETARRDIIALEALGVLRRVHGGAVAVKPTSEPPLAVRSAVRAREKRAIARAAARLMQPGQTVFLDAGSTTTMLAEELSAMAGLTIFTNSLDAARKLAAASEQTPGAHQVIVIGGELAPGGHALIGAAAIANIYRYRADFAMLSPVGIDANDGASSYDHQETEVARAMTQRAARLVILADHGKLGVTSRAVYAPPADIALLITDKAALQQPAFQALSRVLNEAIIAE